MKTYFVAVLLLLTSITYAQTFEFYNNYERMLEATQTKGDKVNFEMLLGKFNKNEELKKYELIALIVGATGHKGYQSADVEKMENQMATLIENKEYEKAIVAADKCLQLFPLSAEAFVTKFTAYRELGDKEKSDFGHKQATVLFQGIQKCGSGERRSSPSIGLSAKNIELFGDLYAAGAGYKFVATSQDDEGNTVIVYKYFMGDHYFVIPKKRK